MMFRMGGYEIKEGSVRKREEQFEMEWTSNNDRNVALFDAYMNCSAAPLLANSNQWKNLIGHLLCIRNGHTAMILNICLA